MRSLFRVVESRSKSGIQETGHPDALYRDNFGNITNLGTKSSEKCNVFCARLLGASLPATGRRLWRRVVFLGKMEATSEVDSI